MINARICREELVAGRPLVRTIPGEAAHAIWGPYEAMKVGVYQVDFELALATIGGDPHEICAVLDVTTDCGTVSLGKLPLRRVDLSTELRTYSLVVVLRGNFALEHRVYTPGTTELLINPVRNVTRVSGVLDLPPQSNLGILAQDMNALGEDTRRILRRLRPHEIRGVEKVRLGRPFDGGYVCVDDFEGIDTAFSFGIDSDISWDEDVAARGVKVYQFDHTVTDPAPDEPRMVFEPKRIARESGPQTQSLSDLIRAHDKGRNRPNLILKTDIEGAEWDVIDATSEDDLARLAWITGEFHYFQGLAEASCRDLIDRALARLTNRFALVHVHSNVWGGYSSLANTIVPNVIEATFANRAVYDVRETQETFPTSLDHCCDPAEPDFFVGAFRY